MRAIPFLRFTGATAALLAVSVVSAHLPADSHAIWSALPSAALAQGPATGQRSDVRMQLNHLLPEHTVLAGITTQKAATDAPDFQAAFNHLDQNSMMLSQWVGSIYGADAAAQFLPLWQSHIQYYLDYTMATGRQDAAGRDQARTALGSWVQAQASQFAALNPSLPADTIAAELTTHVNGTLAAIDTFAQSDYDRHYDIAHQAFDHSFMMADMMANAVAQQFPDRLAQEPTGATARR